MKIDQNGWTRWLALPLAAALIYGIVLLPGVAVGSQPSAQEMRRDAESPAAIGRWSDQVWRSALESDTAEADSFAAFYQTLPTEAGDGPAVIHFQESVQLRRSNRGKARVARSEARDEALEQMREHVAAHALSAALRSAVEVQTLSDDLDGALKNPELRRIIRWAERRVPEIERERNWLLAQELLFRLRTIYDGTSAVAEYQRLDAHLKRVNRRVVLLARYAPKRLHELRSLRAERQGDEPLGDFNPALTEDWRERNRDINHLIVKAALKTAAKDHIESEGWRPLLRGGLEALKLFATTRSLDETFPLLGEDGPVDAWVGGIEGELRQLQQTLDEDLAPRSLRRLIDRVIKLNLDTIAVDRSVIYREFAEGAMNELDLFSEIIWPHRFLRFTQTTRGNFIGVGIVIRHDEAHEILVVNPLEGTPAYFAGVKPDDRIAEVDGVSTVGWSLNDAVDKITGRKGTQVTLGLKREGVEDLLQLAIVRDVIKIRTVKGWRKQGIDDAGDPIWDWYVDPISRIAYVRITQFTEDTFNDLDDAWRQAKAAGRPNGLILDLRYNPGGLLSSAVHISNLFVERGIIVSAEDKNGRRAWPAQRARPNLAMIADDGVPTVILVNKGSASASEIVAGCLQAHGAAVVIGERTFGKGSVQTVHQITDKAVLKLTTQYYRLPSPDGGDTPGRLVHKRPGADVWGVDPDIVVTMTPAQIVASLDLRRKADLIPEDDDGNPDPDSPERPDINELLTGGLDPQLEAALLLLQATALGNETDARHAMLN